MAQPSSSPSPGHMPRLPHGLKHSHPHAAQLMYVPFAKAGAKLLFDVISRAYERSGVIITTNTPFENWPEVLGSERLPGAMLDRLTHRGNPVRAG